MSKYRSSLVIFLLVAVGMFFLESSQPDIYKIDPREDSAFSWPYFLYVPSISSAMPTNYLLVYPNNTGQATDEQQLHEDNARRKVESMREMADDLGFPVLVPVFPRTRTHWNMYTHALDRETLLSDVETLQRIDLQLLAMVDDARERLSMENIALDEKVLLFGFSASGMFANRFSILHPDRVRGAAIGSPGGWPLAPQQEWQGVELPYPVGVSDLQELVGHQIDYASLAQVPMFFFMGTEDTNDSVPYNDGYSSEMKDLVFENFGETPLKRWSRAEEIYDAVNLNSRFVTFQGVGHTLTEEMKTAVTEFFFQFVEEAASENEQ